MFPIDPQIDYNTIQILIIFLIQIGKFLSCINSSYTDLQAQMERQRDKNNKDNLEEE